MRVLFYGAYPNQKIGYSKIANYLTNYLADNMGIEIYYFGISNFIKEEDKEDRYVSSNIEIIDAYKDEIEMGEGNLYGINVFCNYVEKIEPDIVFIYNDLVVCSMIFNKLKEYTKREYKIYTYLDLVYEYERLDMLSLVYDISDKIFVFTDFWKKHLDEIFVKNDKVKILYHGIDKSKIFKKDVLLSKKACGFDEDSFIVLNTNRNTNRKATDISIAGFLSFLKMCDYNDNIKMFLNCEVNQKTGYNLIDVIDMECHRLDIDVNKVLTNHILIFGDKPTDERMNDLYNACEVGVNSCIGEGFGLCNVEHASLGKPQVISKVTSFKDIFEKVGDYSFVEPVVRFQVCNSTNEHRGYVEYCDYKDFGKRLYDIYNNYGKYLSMYEEFSNDLTSKYDWEKILNNFVKEF